MWYVLCVGYVLGFVFLSFWQPSALWWVCLMTGLAWLIVVFVYLSGEVDG